jgi:hypothetical protein
LANFKADIDYGDLADLENETATYGFLEAAGLDGETVGGGAERRGGVAPTLVGVGGKGSDPGSFIGDGDARRRHDRSGGIENETADNTGIALGHKRGGREQENDEHFRVHCSGISQNLIIRFCDFRAPSAAQGSSGF